MKTLLLMAKVVALVAFTFALLEVGFLLHETRIDLTPLTQKLGAMLQSAIYALDAARQTAADVDSGVSFEVHKIEKPPSKAMRILTGIAGILAKAVL